MTPDQVKAIQESFVKVAPIAEQAAALFYGRLFETAPAVKPLSFADRIASPLGGMEAR